jgi:rhomboid protease GluP
MSNGLHHPNPSHEGAHLRRLAADSAPSSVQRYAVALDALTPTLWLTHLLIGLNVAVFVAMAIAGVSPLDPSIEGLVSWGANFGPRTTGGQWWRLASSEFVHIGLVHIAMNMLALKDIGRFVERVFGQAGYLVVYACAGLTGSVASVAWTPFAVSAGASGAIFGLYGALVAYIVRCRHAIPGHSLAGLRTSAITFLGYNVVLGCAHKGTDVAAHFGGLAGGFLIGLLVAHPPTEEAASYRSVRALVATSLGAVIVAAAIFSLEAVPDLDGQLERLHATETQVVDAFNRALGEAHDGKLDDDALAARIETEVLEPWRSARAVLAEPRALPDAQRAIVEKYVRYVDARSAAWERAVAALRAHDSAAYAAADADIRAALKILD